MPSHKDTLLSGAMPTEKTNHQFPLKPLPREWLGAGARADNPASHMGTAARGRMIDPDEQRQLKGGKLLLALDPNTPGSARFVGRHERVDISEGKDRFHTLDYSEVERMLGHPFDISPDGKPILSDEDTRVLGASAAIRDTVLNNPNLTHKEKLRILEKVRGEQAAEIGKIRRERAVLQAKIKTNEEKDAELRRRQDALVEVGEWLQMPLTLAKPDGSLLHRFREAGHAGEVAVLFADDALPVEYGETLDALHSFVVEHNWAGVLSQAEQVGEGSGELAMPFTASCFEFVVSGKRVMAVVNEDPDGVQPTRMAIAVKLEALWAVLLTYTIGDDWKARTVELPPDLTEPVQPLADMLTDNIRAIGILLETKIVERGVIRINAKLNKAREKRGKLPLFDYHVVSLARRERVAPRPLDELDPNREITRKRWHLVRGHWRQYADHRTKIPWHSRGDFDIGIVDKHYKL